MKALVVYDSVFGNTERVALAIAKALGTKADVDCLRVTQVAQRHLAGVEILVVGSPTRGFRHTPAIGRFIKNVPKGGLGGVAVSAFDTRVDVDTVDSRILRTMASIFGYAAKPIEAKLVAKGGRQVVPAEGFVVEGTEGPLRDDELDRAEKWGDTILSIVQPV